MAARLSATLLRTQTDRRLSALAASGSEPAFEALVERYRRPLQAYCRRLLLDGATAEDVVQQAFLSTWQTLRGGTEITDVKPWLFRVVHNGAINAFKRSGYRHEELDDALSGAGAPEEDLDRRIAVRRTLAGLASLPELQREALLRTAVEGRSHEQVARELGLSDSAVRGLVYRARSTLRAAATAVTPAPVAGWVATWSGRETAPMAERIGELVAGGGSAGAAALLLKGSATVVATGAIAGGAVVAERDGSAAGGPSSPPTAQAAERPPSTDSAPAPRPVAPEGTAAPSATDDARSAAPPRRRARDRDDDGPTERAVEERDEDDADQEDDEDDRSGPGDDDDTTDDSSGPGSDGDDDGTDDSAPGSGDDSTSGDSSGPGSAEDLPDTDSSGPGSGEVDVESPDLRDSSGSGSSGTDSSGSGSSGSGSDDADEPDDH